MKAKSLNQLLYTHKKRRSEQFWWPQKINTVWRLANELLNFFRCFFFISTYFKSIIIGVIEWNVLPLRKSKSYYDANALFSNIHSPNIALMVALECLRPFLSSFFFLHFAARIEFFECIAPAQRDKRIMTNTISRSYLNNRTLYHSKLQLY